MDFVRLYMWPGIIGFIICLFINPLEAALGLIVWLALVWYLNRRWTDSADNLP